MKKKITESTIPITMSEWVQQGIRLGNIGKYQDAIMAYDEALKLNPDLKEAWYNKGIELSNMGKHEEALKAYDKALKISSQFTDAWYNKGLELSIIGKHQDAINAYEEAIKIDPKYSAWFRIGISMDELGKLKEAVAAYDEQLKNFPEDIKAWYNKGIALKNMKKYPEAIIAFDKALNINSKYKEAWSSKGYIFLDMGKYEDAINAYDETLKIDSKDKNAWFNKGYSFTKMKRYQDAEAAYKEVLKFDSNDEETLNKLASLNNMKINEETFMACNKTNKKKSALKPKNSFKKKEKSLKIKEEIFKAFLHKTDYSMCPPHQKAGLIENSFIEWIYQAAELKFIGKGGYGKVFLAKRKDEYEKIAVKVIETDSLEIFQESLKELSNLETIGTHPNIMTHLNYLTLTKKKENIFQILIEFPLATTCLENILKKYQRLSEEEIIYLLKQISSGLHFAHQKKMIHLDLKPENILLIANICKITDWGASLRLKNPQLTTVKSEIAWTWGYSAPELEDSSYGKKEGYNYYFCDIYSLGMIILRLCGILVIELRKIPKGMNKYHDLCMDEVIFPELRKEGYSEKLVNLIKKMTSFLPEARISVNEVLDYITNVYLV